MTFGADSLSGPRPLYTEEERRRRDESRWTLVQGLLAPAQFIAFIVSLGLVLRCLVDRRGATRRPPPPSMVKTLFLYAIMVTGSLWEHDVYGHYLFAPAFFWEDAVSMVVIAPAHGLSRVAASGPARFGATSSSASRSRPMRPMS